MKPLSSAPGRLLVLPSKIRVGWKGLPRKKLWLIADIRKLRPYKLLLHLAQRARITTLSIMTFCITINKT